MSLCASCQQFDLRSLSRTIYRWRNLSSKSVLAAAQEGCYFCRLLVSSLGQRAEQMMRSATSSWVLIYLQESSPAEGMVRKGLGVRWLHATVSYDAKPSHLSTMEGYCTFHVAADEGTPAAVSGDVSGRYVDEASPLDSVKLVKDWWTATETHTACSRTLSGCLTVDSNQTPLPTRCIRVTSSSKVVAMEFTLEETQGKHGRYICLSHRWIQPDSKMSPTTASNYTARTSGTGFGNLPRNFLQAFRTAAGFGIQYIWIDTLCIIQDVASDWEEESMKMGDYYQQAMFTLVSTLPTGDPGAEYSAPRPRSLARLPYRDDTGMRRGYFYVYPRRSPSKLAKQFTEHLRASQILTRGWVFQEWLLSRRIVCFTQSGVYVQCSCPNDTVRNQLGEDIGLTFHNLVEAPAVLPVKSSLHLELHTAENIYAAWEAIVEQYSILAFSYPDKDRIRALLGVAREFGTALSRRPCHKDMETAADGFIAALWERDLHRGLLWEQAKPGTHTRLANLPTWSWASLNAAVRWRSRRWISIDHPSIPMLDDQRWYRGKSTSKLSFVACTSKTGHQTRLVCSPRVLSDSVGTLLEPPQQEDEGVLRFAGGEDDMEPTLDVEVLHLRGRLQPVHIGERFSNTIPDLIGFDGDDSELSSLRGIATAGLRDVIGGWASVEHPEFQQDSAFASSPLIFALLVSTPQHNRPRSKKIPSTFAKGLGTFNVLYLRRTQRVVDGFERVGVGRLFGIEAGRGFHLAQERDVKLL